MGAFFQPSAWAARLAVGAVALAAAPAFGQAWIGTMVGNMVAQAAEARCMSGTPLPEKEIAEAHEPAVRMMQLYWSRAAAADKADISAAYHPSGKAEWKMGDRTVRRCGLVAIEDRLARAPGAALAGEPIAFVRAGDSGGARGLWLVGGAGGGYYLAEFKRQAGVYKLASIQLYAGGAAVPAVTQYCHKAGDIEAYRQRMAEAAAKRAARKAAREAQRQPN
jgi:hypothetical protein